MFCVGPGIITLMSISDGLGSYIFYRTMEKMRPMGEEMDEEVFNSHQSRHFFFVDNIIKVLFPSLYLELAFKQ